MVLEVKRIITLIVHAIILSPLEASDHHKGKQSCSHNAASGLLFVTCTVLCSLDPHIRNEAFVSHLLGILSEDSSLLSGNGLDTREPLLPKSQPPSRALFKDRST